MPEQKEPWLKFWVQSWRADSGLRACSWGAKGLWIDMICVMHEEGVPYGHLALKDGVPMPSDKMLAKLGGQSAELRRMVAELEDNKVFSRTNTGVIFSRKMVRDHRRSGLLKQNGSKGGIANAKAVATAFALANTIARSDFSPLTSGSEADSEEKTPGGNDNEPVIPTVEEIVTFGSGPAGIDPDYCRKYHAICTEKQRWLTPQGRALLWRLEIVRWWAGERATWAQKRPAAAKESLDDIRAELQWQKDPARVAALLKKLRGEEGK